MKKYQPIGSGMVPSATATGEFLRKKRLALKLSQVELSGRVDMGQGFYSGLERGELGTVCLFRHAEALADALRFDQEELDAFIPAPVVRAPKTALGKLIFTRCKALGLGLADVVVQTGIGRYHLNRLVYGNHQRIFYATACKLADALELGSADFREFIRPQRF